MVIISANRRRFVLACFSCCSIILIFLISSAALRAIHSGFGEFRECMGRNFKDYASPQHEGSQPPFPNRVFDEAGNQTLSAAHDGWEFIPARDERNYGLSDEQCDMAFPDFYHEIDRATQYWREHGPITEQDVSIAWQRDSGMLRLLIFDQQLFVVDKFWTEPGFDVVRGLALLHSLNRAILTAPSPIPDIEFTINVGDWPNDPDNVHPTWVLSRADQDTSKWVMPDFGYWSWPLGVLGEYTQVRNEIRRTEPSWAEKRNQAVWRGATGTNPLRGRLVEAAMGKEWSDIKAVHWEDNIPVASDGESAILTMPEHCRYRFVVHTEGHSYSGRTKYLLNCDSVSITHKQDWTEPHSHLYRASGPDQNVVVVRRDFSDLDGAMRALLGNETEARRIAANNVRVFRDRYLTPAAQTCYWRRMFRAWAGVSGFRPRLYSEAERDGGIGANTELKLRGMSFESFVVNLYDPSALRGPVEWIKPTEGM